MPNDNKNKNNSSLGVFDTFEGEAIPGRNKLVDFFYSLWLEKGGPERTIRRADINPIEIKKYIEHVVIMDVVRGETADDWRLNVRLMGSHATYFFGNITGKDVRELENSGTMHRIYHLSKRLLEIKEPIMISAPGYSPDRPYKSAVGLYLPLFDEEKKVAKILIAVDVVNRDDDPNAGPHSWGL